MIGMVREWLTSIVVVAMLLSVAQTLIPEGTIRRIASFTCGLILLVTLLQPVLGADLEQLSIHLEDYEAKIQTRLEELEGIENGALAEIIEGRTAAYISDKADALGLEVTVQVTAEPGADGVMMPVSAEIKGSRSETLALYIEEELGIPRGRQIWHEN